ncbi:mating-type protein A-1, partial [Lasiosphaeris hirsuta]
AYYSSLFSHLPQKQRSPMLTSLWQHDPFHNEWHFLTGVYSTLRNLLNQENISFKDWISSAVEPLGIPVKGKYMQLLGWKVANNTVTRDQIQAVKPALKPIDELGLFSQCLKKLTVANP